MLHQSDGLFQTADGELVPATYAARNLYAQRRTHTTLTAQRKKTTINARPACAKLQRRRKKKIMPSNKVQLLQDPFLNMLRKEHIPVSIYLVNGIKLQGQIESFDQYVVILRNTLTQMVYKHAISTVVPSRAVSMTAQPAGDATEN